MKKLIVVSLVLIALTSCGGNAAKEDKNDANDITGNPDYQKGLAIVAKNDCLTCHKIDEPLTGPPYREVANKYAVIPNRDSVLDYLSKKIISGGMGVWGQIPMLPHASLSADDAKAAVKYILLLKK
ncbi:MAG: cytochrome c class I [Bacteroidota bacterium]|nr:cytochrome c class I [Bacteroidota bacterium]